MDTVLSFEIELHAKLRPGNFILSITYILNYFVGKSWHVIKKLNLLILLSIYLILEERSQKLFFTQVIYEQELILHLVQTHNFKSHFIFNNK